MANHALFCIGQVVHHRLFDYIGLIYEVDPYFMLSDEWYDQVAKSKPAKDQPWYHVLVNNGIHSTYVSEQNLAAMERFETVNHPDIDLYFDGIEGRQYRLKKGLSQ